MRHLHERADDLGRGGVTPFAISLDHPWSQRAWSEALAVGTIRLLSDRAGEAASAFGVLADHNGLPMAARSAFLLRGDRGCASWRLSGSPPPDVDAIVAAAAA